MPSEHSSDDTEYAMQVSIDGSDLPATFNLSPETSRYLLQVIKSGLAADAQLHRFSDEQRKAVQGFANALAANLDECEVSPESEHDGGESA